MEEQPLVGGVANAGRVVRVGDHVLRPPSPHAEAIHAFLRMLREAGFEGASLPVGLDEDGQERLVFINGDVPVPPYPAWAQDDTALASTAGRRRARRNSLGDRPVTGLLTQPAFTPALRSDGVRYEVPVRFDELPTTGHQR